MRVGYIRMFYTQCKAPELLKVSKYFINSLVPDFWVLFVCGFCCLFVGFVVVCFVGFFFRCLELNLL